MKINNLYFVFFIIFTVFLILPKAVKAANYYISPTGSGSRDGSSSANALGSFSSAWSKLQPGDTLILLDGTYSENNSGIIQPNV